MVDWVTKFLERNARALGVLLRELSAEERHYLEYFWNKSKKEIRYEIPRHIIYFLESEQTDASLSQIVEGQVRLDMSSLARKGYITETGKDVVYKLTPQGVEYVKDQHPKLIVLWERLFERTPKLVSLFIAAIGFIASVFGIIEFIRK